MIKPTENRVLVKIIKPDEKTAGGLIIPGAALEEMEKRVVTGEVIRWNLEEKPEFKEGDIVVFKMYIAEEIEEDGIQYGILEYDDILAILG